jgi:hypothetical protein
MYKAFLKQRTGELLIGYLFLPKGNFYIVVINFLFFSQFALFRLKPFLNHCVRFCRKPLYNLGGKCRKMLQNSVTFHVIFFTFQLKEWPPQTPSSKTKGNSLYLSGQMQANVGSTHYSQCAPAYTQAQPHRLFKSQERSVNTLHQLY